MAAGRETHKLAASNPTPFVVSGILGGTRRGAMPSSVYVRRRLAQRELCPRIILTLLAACLDPSLFHSSCWLAFWPELNRTW